MDVFLIFNYLLSSRTISNTKFRPIISIILDSSNSGLFEKKKYTPHIEDIHLFKLTTCISKQFYYITPLEFPQILQFFFTPEKSTFSLNCYYTTVKSHCFYSSRKLLTEGSYIQKKAQYAW